MDACWSPNTPVTGMEYFPKIGISQIPNVSLDDFISGNISLGTSHKFNISFDHSNL